jgi:two-component system KDP operon response regulator KdpE
MANILVVDDEEVMRTALAVMLRRDGHEVTVSAGVREALASFDGGGFDVVVTDIMMPEIDGLELIRRLRARSAEIPIIAMSGVRAGGLSEAQALGATRAVAKPFAPPEFRAVLRTVLPAGA